ncbi:transposase [Candidatus Venteria ishoeyi]|uniref:transposase n=1 Tax=Candidatus Venteria ishoeyi TaxID=1899563 RepID=UPI00387E2999
MYDKNLVERYLKRWEIERIFKSEKQEFDLEKIGTTKITRTDNLIYMVQLCM